ncbi:MAG: hypothetical protein P4L33_12960 [Capsulimonadaceae bacterium]|nr:hypothetical protein [Capsulimonadaceae bacterium]
MGSACRTASRLPDNDFAGSFSIAIGGWTCCCEIDDEELRQSLSDAWSPYRAAPTSDGVRLVVSDAGSGAYRVFAENREGPIDLGNLLASPEGARFRRVEAQPLPAFADSLFSNEPVIESSGASLRVFTRERMAHYAMLVIIWLSMAEGGLICLHSAVCAVDEHAIVLAGPSGSGKSTLAWALDRLGAACCTDEWLFLRREGGPLIPLPRSISLRPEGARLLGVQPEPSRLYESRPGDVKIATERKGRLRSFDGPANVYFLSGFAASPRITAASPAESLRRLLGILGTGDDDMNARIDTALALTERFRCWLLEVGDPSETARTLIRRGDAR